MKNVVFGLILGQLALLPLSRRYGLDLGRAVPGGLAAGLAAGILVAAVAVFVPLSFHLQVLLTVVLVVAGCAAWFARPFFRTGEWAVQGREDVVVSPADGTVEYVKRIEKEDLPLSTKGKVRQPLPDSLVRPLSHARGYLVGIRVTPLDRRVTRSPIKGEVALSEFAADAVQTPRRWTAFRGETRMIQVVDNGEAKVGLIHTTSSPWMRVTSSVKTGDRVSVGQRIGAIRFDSQVDLVLPDNGGLEIQVNVGDRVFAGVTIIARFRTAEVKATRR